MEHDDATWKFGGFSSPNFTAVPDEFFDDLAPRLGSAELKVLLYIVRRTFGFKKERDSISLSQMVDGIVKKNGQRLDRGTGLKKAAVCKALTSLESKKIIVRTKQYSFSGGAVATSYQLHMRGRSVSTQTTKETPVCIRGQGYQPPCPQTETGGVHETKQALSTYADTQYTVTNKQGNNNVNVSKKDRRAETNNLHLLSDVHSEPAHIKLIADDILEILGDTNSTAFYRLVARKVPERHIRRILSELKEGRARSKAKVFTHQMMQYAEGQVEQEFNQKELKEDRQTLVQRLKYE